MNQLNQSVPDLQPLIQSGATQIAKLVYNSNNYGLWYLLTIVAGDYKQPSRSLISGVPTVFGQLIEQFPKDILDRLRWFCLGIKRAQ